MIKIKSGFYSKNNQNGKTKAVVWNAIWTAMKPEKKIWAAEIEIYLLVMSNGLSGIRKIWKWSVCFRFSDRFGIAMLLTANYFNVLVFRKALKAQISCSKIDFGSKFRQKHFFDIFSIFVFSFFSFSFFTFWHFVVFTIFAFKFNSVCGVFDLFAEVSRNYCGAKNFCSDLFSGLKMNAEQGGVKCAE